MYTILHPRPSARALVALVTLFTLGLGAAAPADAFWFFSRKAPTLVDRLEQKGNFTVLLAALEATGLDEVLADRHADFTVFAPDDDAFAPLVEDGTVATLLGDEEGLAILSDILLYHVAPGAQTLVPLLVRGGTETVLGPEVRVRFGKGGVLVEDTQLGRFNNRASNGVFHVIDGVLMPPADVEEEPNLVELLEEDGRFTVLLAALEATGLDEVLEDEEAGFSVFAPTDAAFAPLVEDGTVDALLADEEGRATLEQILLYHVVPRRLSLRELIRERRVDTALEGASVRVIFFLFWAFVNDSLVVDPDLEASNGTAQAIGRVLSPPAEH